MEDGGQSQRFTKKLGKLVELQAHYNEIKERMLRHPSKREMYDWKLRRIRARMMNLGHPVLRHMAMCVIPRWIHALEYGDPAAHASLNRKIARLENENTGTSIILAQTLSYYQRF